MLQVLNTEKLGQVSGFKAVPGYGIECTVSNILPNILPMIESTSRDQVLSNCNTEEVGSDIDGLLAAASDANSSKRLAGE